MSSMPIDPDSRYHPFRGRVPMRLRGAGLSMMSMLLPPHCLLCGARGQTHIDLCSACARDMPRNRPCCLHCGMPLAVAG
ncbi:MAG: double zinc ribbon domain-containing protein, partial [Rhodanobacteraceae bacterium]